MKDAVTKQPLRVEAVEGPLSYLWVPLSQLDEVRKVLDAGKVPYSVSEIAIALDDEPEGVSIHLARGTDAEAVQRLLDSVP